MGYNWKFGRSRRWAAAAGAVIVLAACSDQPTALQRGAGTSFDRTVRRDAGWKGNGDSHRSSEKYSDNGRHKDWGRSGSAAIEASALVDKGGVTDLAVTSYAAADTTTPAGSIIKVIVFGFVSRPKGNGHDRDDGQLFFKSYDDLDGGSTFTTQLTGLGAGIKLRVLALVRGIDRRRTDVVTDTMSVVKGPDLAVTSVGGASQGFVGTPVLVTATVAEINGAVGAHAACNLYDGTAKVDSVPDIWVDAGSSVSCAFAPTFASAATRTLAVRVENVRPRDYDPSNNSGTFTVAIVVPPPPSGGGGGPPPPIVAPPALTYNAMLLDQVISFADTTFQYDWNLSNVLTDSIIQDTSQIGHTQSSEFHGIIYAAVSFPITQWALGLSTGGTSLDSMNITNVPAVPGSAVGSLCSTQTAVGVVRTLCTYPADNLFPYGRSTLDYMRFAGLATYESRKFSDFTGTAGGGRCQDPNASQVSDTLGTTCWFRNAAPQATGTLAAFGATIAFTAKVISGGVTYTANLSVPLSTTTQTVATSCNPLPARSLIAGVGYTVFCDATHLKATNIGGTKQGTGITVLTP
jgi:hypothetical protein